ncbi:MAG: hypothetical protein QOF18_1860, partial [Frankiaceae bacterium]|nr:hypothetical protein [Frankiaceae bacterium]
MRCRRGPGNRSSLAGWLLSVSALLAGAAAALAVAVLRSASRRPAQRLRELTNAARGRDATEPWAAGSGPRRWPVVLVLALPGLPVLAGVAPVALFAGPVVVVIVAWTRRRRARQVARARGAAVVDLAFALAAELRAGHPPPQALAAAASSSGALERPLAAAATAACGATADELR